MTLRRFVFGVLVALGVAAVSYLSVPLHAPESGGGNSGAAALAEAVRRIDAGKSLTPLIGEQPRRGLPTVTFLARVDGKDAPRIVSDVTGWGERADGNFDFKAGKMTRIPGTEWFSLETKVEPYARIEYLIAYGAGDYRMDPFNPRKVQRVGGPASEIVMPGYVPPQEFVDPPMRPAGNVIDTTINSRVLKASRRVIVYTPPGYRGDIAYPLAVFHDGALMVNTGEAPRVLDWLIGHQAIPPIVAVFVEPISRADDYRRGSPMRSFVTDEVLPWVSTNYSVTRNPAERAIIGVSAGARGALDAASATAAFGRVGLMIPALDQNDIDAIPQKNLRPLRFSIVAAHYDALNLAAARGAQLTAADRGQAVDFKEVPEGHSTQTWRGHLRDVLISLFGEKRR